MQKPAHLLGIAGPSCSGKTSLAHLIARRLPAVVLALDSYYLDLSHLPLAERARTNFDDPARLDWDLLLCHAAALSRGETIERPVYDFATHSRQPEAERLAPAPLVILEGLFALWHERLRGLLDRRIYIAVDDAVCLARRLTRDTTERGRTPESVLEQYARTVRPMAERYVYPSRKFADLVVSGAGALPELEAAVMAWLTGLPPVPGDQRAPATSMI